MIPLFDSDSEPRSHERLEEGAVLLRSFATSEAPVLSKKWRGSRRERRSATCSRPVVTPCPWR